MPNVEIVRLTYHGQDTAGMHIVVLDEVTYLMPPYFLAEVLASPAGAALAEAMERAKA